MIYGPKINGNPFKIAVFLLVTSYIVGEFFLPKYPLAYFIQLIGILGLIFSAGISIAGFNLFKSYDEDNKPSSITNRLITTGVNAYTRNPIYLSFVSFLLSMFFVFENVMYFLSAVSLAIWLHHWVIKAEEDYLQSKFKDEFDRYKISVKRWIFF